MLQTLLETTADDLLNVFKTNRQIPELSDQEVRGDILRELYGIREALISKYNTKQQLETSESMYKPGESVEPITNQLLVKKSEPSTLLPSLNSATNTGLTGGTAVDSEQEHSIAEIEPSPQVGQKRTCKDLDLSQPPTKGRYTAVPMIDFNYSGIIGGSSSASRKKRDDTTSGGKVNADVVPNKTKPQPGKKRSHSTSKTSNSANWKRTRGSRCPKSKRNLCPICSLPDCGECKNCQ